MDRDSGDDKRTVFMFYDDERYHDLLNLEIISEDMTDVLKRYLNNYTSIGIRDVPRGKDPITVSKHFEGMLGDVRVLAGPVKGYYVGIGDQLERLVLDDFGSPDDFGFPFTYYAFRKGYQPELNGIVDRYIRLHDRLEHSKDKRISRAIEGPGFLMFRDE